jgi:hypothetical protein
MGIATDSGADGSNRYIPSKNEHVKNQGTLKLPPSRSLTLPPGCSLWIARATSRSKVIFCLSQGFGSDFSEPTLRFQFFASSLKSESLRGCAQIFHTAARFTLVLNVRRECLVLNTTSFFLRNLHVFLSRLIRLFDEA